MGIEQVAIPPTRTVRRPAHYRAFGLFRLVLALLVVVSHSWLFTYRDPTGVFWHDIGLGNVAVMGFFVLSGFIISEAVATFYDGRPRAFIVNRLLRIWPPYLGALLLAVVAFWFLLPEYHVVTQNGVRPGTAIFNLPNLFNNLFSVIPYVPSISPPPPGEHYAFVEFTWAIRVEMAFYLAVFGMMLVMRSPLGGIVTRSARRLSWDVAIVAVWAGLLLHFASEYVLPKSLYVLSFAPYFALGVALHRLEARPDTPGLRTLVAVATLLSALHFSRYTQGELPVGSAWADGLTDPVVIVPTLLMLSTAWLMWRLRRLSPDSQVAAVDKRSGQFSYPVYINHSLVLTVFLTLTATRGWFVQVAVVAASFVLAVAMNELVERPIQGARDRVRGRSL